MILHSDKAGYLAMAGVVAASNYLVLFPLNDWLTLGAFTYPLSFLVNELTNSFHGPQKARKVVWVGFALAVLLSIFLATPRIAFASGTAFLISQLMDIYVFCRFRQLTWWCAPFFASLVAAILDTAIFWSLAFWGEQLPWFTWMTGDFCVKLAADCALLIPFRFALRRRLSINPSI